MKSHHRKGSDFLIKHDMLVGQLTEKTTAKEHSELIFSLKEKSMQRSEQRKWKNNFLEIKVKKCKDFKKFQTNHYFVSNILQIEQNFKATLLYICLVKQRTQMSVEAGSLF